MNTVQPNYDEVLQLRTKAGQPYGTNLRIFTPEQLERCDMDSMTTPFTLYEVETHRVKLLPERMVSNNRLYIPHKVGEAYGYPTWHSKDADGRRMRVECAEVREVWSDVISDLAPDRVDDLWAGHYFSPWAEDPFDDWTYHLALDLFKYQGLRDEVWTFDKEDVPDSGTFELRFSENFVQFAAGGPVAPRRYLRGYDTALFEATVDNIVDVLVMMRTLVDLKVDMAVAGAERKRYAKDSQRLQRKVFAQYRDQSQERVAAMEARKAAIDAAKAAA